MGYADKEALRTELEEIENVVDDTENEESGIVHYNITTYGADFDVEDIVRRLEREEIFIPPFQRSFIWKMTEASKFVESLLLGLPVPAIFLAKDQDTNKLLVIDGQQRLKTLQFFYDGIFKPSKDEKAHKIFKLTKIKSQFENRTYKTLEERDRRTLDNSIIHAFVVKQDLPRGESSSIYHIYERLNNGGRILTPQEIRCAIYHGKLIDFIHKLNQNVQWREIYGKNNSRLKDEELILRFFALFSFYKEYKAPMKDFINSFAEKYKDLSDKQGDFYSHLFVETIKTIFDSIGKKAFRIGKALNAAIFDSVAVGVAKRIERGPIKSKTEIKKAYEILLKDSAFIGAVSQSTASEALVAQRIASSISTFKKLQ